MPLFPGRSSETRYHRPCLSGKSNVVFLIIRPWRFTRRVQWRSASPGFGRRKSFLRSTNPCVFGVTLKRRCRQVTQTRQSLRKDFATSSQLSTRDQDSSDSGRYLIFWNSPYHSGASDDRIYQDKAIGGSIEPTPLNHRVESRSPLGSRFRPTTPRGYAKPTSSVRTDQRTKR